MLRFIRAASIAVVIMCASISSGLAQPINVGGSFERGYPWYGPSHLNRYGVQGTLPEHFGPRLGGYRYGGPVYYRSGGYNMRYGYRSRGYAYSYAAPSPTFFRLGGNCYRAGIRCPCPPRRYAKRYYSPRVYRPAHVVRTARPACSTCGGSTVIEQNPKIQVGNIGEGATVTINQTSTQQVGGVGVNRPSCTTCNGGAYPSGLPYTGPSATSVESGGAYPSGLPYTGPSVASVETGGAYPSGLPYTGPSVAPAQATNGTRYTGKSCHRREDPDGVFNGREGYGPNGDLGCFKL